MKYNWSRFCILSCIYQEHSFPYRSLLNINCLTGVKTFETKLQTFFTWTFRVSKYTKSCTWNYVRNVMTLTPIPEYSCRTRAENIHPWQSCTITLVPVIWDRPGWFKLIKIGHCWHHNILKTTANIKYCYQCDMHSAQGEISVDIRV